VSIGVQLKTFNVGEVGSLVLPSSTRYWSPVRPYACSVGGKVPPGRRCVLMMEVTGESSSADAKCNGRGLILNLFRVVLDSLDTCKMEISITNTFDDNDGDVAHMVERSLRMREARCSIPRVSMFLFIRVPKLLIFSFLPYYRWIPSVSLSMHLPPAKYDRVVQQVE
jgi:hypothetical protein